MKKALISVTNKNGIVVFAKGLIGQGYEILSTGGTLKVLKENRIAVTAVSDYTGQPEILGGRVKTLHPKIHGGILGIRDDATHQTQMQVSDIDPIDLVVVNLYAFSETAKKQGVSIEDVIEQIDIGGPSMIRSAAKNHRYVTVVVDPCDYESVLKEMSQQQGDVSAETKKRLAAKAFAITASYDAAIASYLLGKMPGTNSELPNFLFDAFERSQSLRYGENPHQKASLYQSLQKTEKFKFDQLHGKDLSFNNLLDVDAVLDILSEFNEPSACVVKHNNPCGIAEASNIEKACSAAIDSDPVSAFGGIVGVNRKCTQKAAQVIMKKLSFFEVLIAPGFDAGALKTLKTKKNLRLISVKANAFKQHALLHSRLTRMGLLVQQKDSMGVSDQKQFTKSLRQVTKKKTTAAQLKSLIFAWKCAKVVRSNAIVLTKGTATVGIGAGQMSRVDAVKIACEKAGKKRTKGACLASDGFFPMPDNIRVAHRWGVQAIIQPGGSIRDPEVIQACDRSKIAMLLTGMRHFRH